ncbi:YcnI family protein [Pseudonocardia sp.]|uniref:YcnI family copper-binding membrane protein n=1 Tax=Pseudonocardia sp. TaxID=60912 RepID=UPI003D0BA4C3
MIVRSLARTAAVVAAAAALVVAAAAPALAHVTAQPGRAEQGGYTVVSMRVPNESDTAGTVKLEVSLPADTPITGVRTTPVPGWTATVTKAALNPPLERHGRQITEVVRTVTWTAQPGTRIGPGEFLEFPLSLGPMPTGVDRILLPAVQTYDDGEIVRWDQPPADGAEPERPAPVVELTAVSSGDGHGAAAAIAAGAGGLGGADGTDSTARWLGGAGLLLGGLGLGLGVGALLRGRRGSA